MIELPEIEKLRFQTADNKAVSRITRLDGEEVFSKIRSDFPERYVALVEGSSGRQKEILIERFAKIRNFARTQRIGGKKSDIKVWLCSAKFPRIEGSPATTSMTGLDFLARKFARAQAKHKNYLKNEELQREKIKSATPNSKIRIREKLNEIRNERKKTEKSLREITKEFLEHLAEIEVVVGSSVA